MQVVVLYTVIQTINHYYKNIKYSKLIH